MEAPLVLLVDSDPDSHTIYALMLEHHGLRVLHAHDPREGFRIAGESRPAVVVAELFLPLVEGRPLVERLREDPRTAGIGVIGLTSLTAEIGAAPGLAACDSHLLKPCSPSRLLREVQRVVHRGAPLREPLSVGEKV